MKKLGKVALSILKGIAPVAASALGGPFAGPALSIIANSLGISEDKVDDYIMSGSPDELLKLRQAEIDFEKWRQQAGIKLEELVFADRAGARDLAKIQGILVQALLSAVFILGYFGMVYFMVTSDVFREMDDFAKGQVAVLIGVLTAAIPQILAFWFGSSRGSKEKTDAITTALQNGNGH